MDNRFTISCYHGKEIANFITQLAELRITVFREYPYLYEGNLEYEKKYMTRYLNEPESVLVIARENQNIIGASSGLPLEKELAPFKQPFIEHNYDLNSIFYCSESVLLKPYRGYGIGKQFFIEREKAAKKQKKYQYIAFCAVIRDEHDSRKPTDYYDLKKLWTQQGFVMEPSLVTEFSWPEVGSTEETTKKMQFWLKKI